MRRIYILCEGQTEETFVNEVLSSHFYNKKILLIPLTLRGHVSFSRIWSDAQKVLRKENEAYCTTFIDFYGLPSDFPGKISEGSIEEKSTAVCKEMLSGFIKNVGENTSRRFLPYIQMHEFEALLFSDPTRFAIGIGHPDKANRIAAVMKNYTSPEEINDNVLTAPSKRVKQIILHYDKPLYGSLAAIEIGLPRIREKCRLFDAWIQKLEELE